MAIRYDMHAQAIFNAQDLRASSVLTSKSDTVSGRRPGDLFADTDMEAGDQIIAANVQRYFEWNLTEIKK